MDDDFDIAIVGLACRFPGAKNAEEFWRNLAAGVESITRLSDEEILQSGAPASHLTAPNYVKAAPVLDEPGAFDAAFFGFTPGEARTMDPQHRILLELAHEAFEDAGCVPADVSGRVGVFTGAAMNTYFTHAGLSRNFAEDYIPTLIFNDKDFLSTRISYKLDLKGPSMTVQTACSTSLVAVHLARQSLLSEECDVALAGAISVRVPHRAGYFSDPGGVSSPDGHVRAFSADANGTVFGSGGGVIVMKRLRDAIADGDTIRAIIKGSAINNDGAEKAGYTAPSVNSQAEAVIEALANANVEADTISYIETHGSGTPVGDPIEVRALTKAFRASTKRTGFCAIGSVKTNLGHLDAAAGMAGLIKTVLALQHRQLPASLNYSQPNPEIDFPATPFFVNTRLAEWQSTGPRRAGIMSTGMGGTNAHVVLEEATPPEERIAADGPALLVISAQSESALARYAENLRARLESDLSLDLHDAAFTLQTGRRAMRHRRFIVASDRAAAIASLAAKAPRLSVSVTDTNVNRPLVLLLPGVGDHYVGMGRELYAGFATFRGEVDRCAEILRPKLGHDIHEILWPKHRDWKQKSASPGIDLKKMLAGNTQPADDEDATRLNEITNLQPALFTIEYALAKLWIGSIGAPQAIVGHSMGEYVAACLSGVLSLEDALHLIVRRTQLVAELPPAKMLAVTLAESELLPLLTPDLSIALINGPALCIVAGPPAAIDALAAVLTAKNVMHRPVQNTHAFHSRMLDPIVPAYTAEVRKVQLRAPRIPFTSNVTGQWITATDATDPGYWARHANHTARFDDALRTLWQMENPILLEAGPGRTLGVLALQHPAKPLAVTTPAVASMRHHYESQPEAELLLTAAGRLWLSGVNLDWKILHDGKPRRKIPLPTYPFERSVHWLAAAIPPGSADASSSTIRKITDATQWFYSPSWQLAHARPVAAEALEAELRSSGRWLVFADECGVASELTHRLRGAAQQVIIVHRGHTFSRVGAEEFTIDPSSSTDYSSLLDAITAGSTPLTGIVHAWSIGTDDSQYGAGDSFSTAQTTGFHSLLHLARALATANGGSALRLFALSTGVHDVHSAEELRPEKSTMLGACLVIPQEFPNIITRCIDLDSLVGTTVSAHAIDLLAGELCCDDAEVIVAHRNGRRWVQSFARVQPRTEHGKKPFREGGTYLITGGLGNVGLTIARHLAREFRAKLLLTGRTSLPARETWSAWLAQHGDEDATSRKLRAILEIEAAGGSVLAIAADSQDLPALRAGMVEGERLLGPLRGVIHAAGVTGDAGYREIRDAIPAQCERHFGSKSRGLVVLDELLTGKQLDFRLILSSLSSQLGGIGQAAYAASNIFADAFARKRDDGAGNWLSVNWDVWRTQEKIWGNSGPGKTLEELGMSGDGAMRAMEMALASGFTGQIIVSTGDLDARVRQWVKLESLRTASRSTSPRNGETDTGGELSEGDEVEQFVAGAWRGVLGIERISATENFMELGGHSLLAMQIVARLRAAYRIDITLREFFEAPTIAQFSATIRDRLLADIENLTDEQVRELIAKEELGHE